jgi:hypothetical protein
MRPAMVPLTWEQIKGQTWPERQDGESTNDYVERLTAWMGGVNRYVYEAKGKLLFLPAAGIVILPFEQTVGGWNCCVVEGNEKYSPDGYNLWIGDGEITTAIEVDWRQG